MDRNGGSGRSEIEVSAGSLKVTCPAAFIKGTRDGRVVWKGNGNNTTTRVSGDSSGPLLAGHLRVQS